MWRFRCLLVLAGWGALGVAMANPVPFSDLARHSKFTSVKISPDGSHVAAVSVLPDGHKALTLLDLVKHTGANVAIRGGDDVLDFWWVSPQYVVYSVSEHLGGWDAPVATGELYSIKADGGDSAILYGYRVNTLDVGTHLQHASAENGSAQFLSAIDGDPDHILVAITPWTTEAGGALTTVYRMDVRTGVKRELALAPMRDASYLTDHHGHVRFAFGENLQGDWVVYVRPVAGGDWRRLPQASTDRDSPLAFSPDDQHAWFTCPGNGGFGVCAYDPQTDKLTVVWSNPHVEMSSLAQGLAEDSVIGVDFTDGRPAVSVFDNTSPGARALIELMKAYPGEYARFVSGTSDGSKAVALVDADADPGRFLLYDRASNKFTLLAGRAPWIDPNALGRAVPFEFKTRDGLNEQGYVTFPPGETGAKNLPLVVYVHGGPYNVRDWWEYDNYVQAMATRGYAVLQVNFRGSGGYGYGFMKAGWHEWGGKMQDDVTDATLWAIQQGIADKNRICIYGGSYGGYAALEGAVKEPNLYKCAIGYVGVYNLPMMVARNDAYVTQYSKTFWQRTVGTDATALGQHSPVYQLDHLKAKVMLIVGGRDKVVLPRQGQELHMALLKRGVQHEWLYQPDEWHGFYDEKHVADLFQRVDAFLAANLGPGVTAPPAASAPASASP